MKKLIQDRSFTTLSISLRPDTRVTERFESASQLPCDKLEWLGKRRGSRMKTANLGATMLLVDMPRLSERAVDEFFQVMRIIVSSFSFKS